MDNDNAKPRTAGEMRDSLLELRAAADEMLTTVELIERLRAEGRDVGEDEETFRRGLRAMGEALIALAGQEP